MFDAFRRLVQKLCLYSASRYTHYVTKAPYLTNAGFGFVIAGVGDTICQKYFEQNSMETRMLKESVVDDIDLRRSFEMGCIRSFVITPFIIFWYPFLVTVCPGTAVHRVFGRVAIDQMIGSPIVIIMVFISDGILKSNVSYGFHQIYHQFQATWIAGIKYWPFVHSINFRFVPLIYQPLFAHFASLYWNAVLSYYSYKKD